MSSSDSIKASCFCGNSKLTIAGEPAMHVLCHCTDCRKISGSMYSDNVIFKQDELSVDSGDLKSITKTADSGNKITSYFCPDCGTTLYRNGEAFPGMSIVKSGIFDDAKWHNTHTPSAELFSETRVDWQHPVSGAKQQEAMGS